MKNSINKTAVLFCLTLVFALFSYSTVEAQSENANIVTIDNGQTWIWIADNCIAPYVLSESVRIQTSNNFGHATMFFQLPEGHCDIPEKGAYVIHYDENNWAKINSNGKVMGKIIINKKDW